MFRIGVGAMPFLMPMMLQLAFGRSRGGKRADHLRQFRRRAGDEAGGDDRARTFGFRDTLVATASSRLGCWRCARAFRPSWPVALIYIVLLVGGFFRSLQFTAYNALAYGEIPRERMSAATSLYSTIQQVSLTSASPSPPPRSPC